MDISGKQRDAIRDAAPQKNFKVPGPKGGRPWPDPREVLDAIPSVFRTGALWKDITSRYLAYQTCHRRFTKWCKNEVLENAPCHIIKNLKERGTVDVTEGFIDGSNVGAKKGALMSVPQKILPRSSERFFYARACAGRTLEKRTSHQISVDFKSEVVQIALEQGRSATDVARGHDLDPGLVAGWMKQARIDFRRGSPERLASTGPDDPVAARKANREFNRENDFQKTAAWFASRNLGGLLRFKGRLETIQCTGCVRN